MAIAIANSNVLIACDEPKTRPMDIPTSLTQQFIHKLRARNANQSAIEEAEKLFRAIRFEDYEESSSARMMQFESSKSDEVIEKFCTSNGWNEETTEDFKFAAALLDEDRKAETWIKFQKGNDGEFYVHFVAMRRIGEKIHMGLARHYVKFKLSPFAKDPRADRRQGYFFYAWWDNFENHAKSNGNSNFDSENGEQQGLTLNEMELLENYFLLKSMIKFTETFPITSNRLPDEDRLYLTMAPNDDF